MKRFDWKDAFTAKKLGLRQTMTFFIMTRPWKLKDVISSYRGIIMGKRRWKNRYRYFEDFWI